MRCVGAGASKTSKIKQKGVKLVDASGVAMKVHAEKAMRAEEKQEWKALMESAGHKGRLERTSAWNGQEIYVKKCRISGRERAVKLE